MSGHWAWYDNGGKEPLRRVWMPDDKPRAIPPAAAKPRRPKYHWERLAAENPERTDTFDVMADFGVMTSVQRTVTSARSWAATHGYRVKWTTDNLPPEHVTITFIPKGTR